MGRAARVGRTARGIMNYFEKLKNIERTLGPWVEKDFPISWPFCVDYVERLLLYKEGNRELEVTNPVRSNFTGTRRWWDPAFLWRSALYYRLPRQKTSFGSSTLISPNLGLRFPRLTERIFKNYNLCMFVSKASAQFVATSPITSFIKIDDIIYNRKIEREFGIINHAILTAVAEDKSLDQIKLKTHFQGLENELTRVVKRLGELLRQYDVRQYICPYSVRYEEILTCLACRQIGIVSKEICHGVNSHQLAYSDNVVPTNTDILYVWTKQYYDNIRPFENFGDFSRVKICGYPKYDIEQINRLQERYPQKKQITYFSQPTYDVGATTDHRVSEEHIRAEAEYRDRVFSMLDKISKSSAYRIRVRYHQGERRKNPGCDRTAEFDRLRSLGFEISDNPFDQDLFESEICLGINSSTLFEAYVVGKTVRQLEFVPAGTNRFRDIAVIPIEAIPSLLSDEKSRPLDTKFNLLLNLEDLLNDRVPTSLKPKHFLEKDDSHGVNA